MRFLPLLWKSFSINTKGYDNLNEPIKWEPHADLRSNAGKLIDFPVHALPPILREMAEWVSVTAMADVAMAATSIISSVSYCFTGQYRIVGKKNHTEPLLVNSLIVAEPSMKKSPTMKPISKPYSDFTKDYNELHKKDIFRNQAKMKILLNKLSALEKCKDADANEMAEIQTQLSEIRNADFRRIIIEDITPESLVRQLSINGTLLMMSDEAGVLGNFNGRYSNAPNLDLLLKSWNGETYISDRITRESITLYKPYVSICLACQPYLWEEMITNTAFRESGFLARICCCFVKDNRGKRVYDTDEMPDDVEENYRKLIYHLLNRKFKRFEANDMNERMIYLDDQVYSNFVEYYNNYIEKQIVTDMYFCADWAGKYHGLILRLCGIIHCVKCFLKGVEPESVKVDIDTYCNAVEIGNYYREQAIYAYELANADAQIVKAVYIIRKVKSKGIREIRQADLYRIVRCDKFANSSEFNSVIDLLEEYRYLVSETVPAANGCNKSGKKLTFNPDIFTL